MNGRPYFDRLVQDLAAGRLPPDAVREWLIDGKRCWETEPDTTLEAALGLIRIRDARHWRDAALTEAVALMPEDWKTSEKVRQVRKVEHRLKPYLTEPELFGFNDRPAWYAVIFEAMRYSPLPKGFRQLHDLCNSNLCNSAGKCKKPGPEYDQDRHQTAEERT